MSRKVRLIDVTLRDAHQCLWATRMTTGMMKELAPRLDRAGFEAIDLVGGAVFDVAVRYLREDPWERMRILNSWVKETPLIIHTRGQSLFTFEFFPDDVVALAAERFAANGMRYHTPYDALNDMRNLEIPIRAAKQQGLYVAGGLVYTVSPVHTDEYYSKKAAELMRLGVDAVYLKDASGLMVPERVATLVKAVKAVIGEMPLQIHTHCNSGLAPYVVLQAVEHGVEVIHTATSTLANGVSHAPTERVVRNLRRRGHEVDLDLSEVEEVAERLAYIAEKEDKPVGQVREYDEFHYHHQCAGGMVSNLQYQLETMGLEHRLEEILEEAGHVRADLGYPIVVSPFAQYIVTQAVLNVMGKDQGKARYDSVPDEVRLYVRGGYGEIAGEIDPDLYDKITRGADPITERPGALVEPALERLRRTRGPFASDDDLLLAAFYDDSQYSALKAAGSIDTNYSLMETPLVTLIREISERPGVRAFHFSKPS
ncbi:pyruvate carboxylase subunit B [Afifella sp. IM 167]|uniref:pyruvate carboxylase subunit B n=1 Tax=Afifella sp. IM 167 TaxID=2033586 RepID=UPI001CCC0624|nr:pyruvate carboxylase subunit B [Afifella sp. IM 167]MBZ8133190.1 carboxylase [Afifella sp. IM 167]